MRTPIINPEFCKERRNKLNKLFHSLKGKKEKAAFVFYSGDLKTRNNDSSYVFRPESNFFYFTGYEEPESVFVFLPGPQGGRSILFVPKKDPVKETWEGFLYGAKAAKKKFLFDEAYTNSEFEEKTKDIFKDLDSVYYPRGVDENFDHRLESLFRRLPVYLRHKEGKPLVSFEDSYVFSSTLRIVKTKEEIELMRKSAEVAVEGHRQIMSAISPGVNERELQGVFQASILRDGASAEAYTSIVASGQGATTLHYIFNDKVCKSGELVLVDAGAEYQYYASDITRVYPVSGQFTEVQKKIYNKVLKVQKKLISMVKPGVTFEKLHKYACRALTKIMIEEKLLKGNLESLIEGKKFKKYYPHGVGHFLGMDVHDAGYTHSEGKPYPLPVGAAITIEPGIYIPKNDKSAPAELRGLGVRIEDDVLITRSGNEVLTEDLPKEIKDIEEFMRTAID